MEEEIRSGHGTPDYWGSYSNIHIKIVIVCAVKDGQVREYWWDVTPSGAQLRRFKDPKKRTKGRIRWELLAFDVETGDELNCSIDRMRMNKDSGWLRKWGKPTRDPRHSNGRNWRMNVQVPGGTDLEAFNYTVWVTVGKTRIEIDPEVDFEPGE